VGASSSIISIDRTSATAEILFPLHGVQRSGLSITSGTIADDFSGVKEAVITLSYLSGNDTWYWDGAWSSPTVKSVTAPAGIYSAATSTWSYSALPASWAPDTVYKIEARGRDTSNNTQDTNIPIAEWLYDVAAPTVSVTNITDQGYKSPVNPLVSIAGTARDLPFHPFADVGAVYVRIIKSEENDYWNGYNWTGNENTWIVAQDTGSWTVPKATCPAQGTSDWCDDRFYTVHVRAKDATVPSYNLSAWTTVQFTYDSTIPDISISDPNLDYEADLPGGITGSASDGSNSRRSKISNTYAAIRYPPTGAGGWWNGTSGFTISDNFCDGGSDDACWIQASTGTETAFSVPWQFHSTPTWVNNTQYRVKTRARDYAGNYSSYQTRDFTYDTSGPPLVGIISPIDGKKSNDFAVISGTAYDLNKIVSSSVSIREYHSGLFWQGSTFSASEYWHTANLTGSGPTYDWTWTMPPLQNTMI